MRQKFRLCEIRAEDYAFVVLSRILNNLEEQVTLRPTLDRLAQQSLNSLTFSNYSFENA
jgi:hypothetical protein